MSEFRRIRIITTRPINHFNEGRGAATAGLMLIGTGFLQPLVPQDWLHTHGLKNNIVPYAEHV